MSAAVGRPVAPFLGALGNASSFAALAAARSPRKQLILHISTGATLEQLAWTANTLGNLRELGLSNFVLLRESEAACGALQALVRRAGLMPALGDAGVVSCAWGSPRRLAEMRLEPGWRKRRFLNDLWLLRWWVAAELLRLRLSSVLILDVDTRLAADPYPVLLAEPLRSAGLVFERDAKGWPALNAGCLWLNMRGAAAGSAVHGVVDGIWRQVQSQRDHTRGKHSSDMDQDVFNERLASAAGEGPAGRSSGGRKANWWTVQPAGWAKRGGRGVAAVLRGGTSGGSTSGGGGAGVFGPYGSWLIDQPLHTRRLRSADGSEELAVAAPPWLFREHIYSAESVPLVSHFVAVEDKMAAARISGWWRPEADIALGVLPGGGWFGGQRGPSAAETARRAALRRHALSLGPAWRSGREARCPAAGGRRACASSLAEQARFLRLVNVLAASSGLMPVWPPLPQPGLGVESLSFRDGARCGGGGGKRRGLVLSEGRTIANVQPCAPGKTEVAEVICTPGACDEGGAPRRCYLNPFDRSKPDVHWSPNRCYTHGGAMFEADASRLVAAGAMRRRPLRLPESVLTNDGAIHLPRFVSWLQGALEGQVEGALPEAGAPRLLVELLPPEGAAMHGARWGGGMVDGAERRLHELAAVCGGDGLGGVLMGDVDENVTGGLCV